ncbi:hypothetical protein HaLaN_07035 [Haematococcus lacustris]|uniref:Uncharacterized protein n=1 Tax=Haematococcus lacustris TaxID=44745 RepID=A0A699YXF4_HAELA|nr:hypothetical protein HaLaN_07035 [Haematococcus lacustris]
MALPSDDAFAAPRPRRVPPPPSFDWSLDPLDSCSNHTAAWATHPPPGFPAASDGHTRSPAVTVPPVRAATGTATRTKGALGPDAAPAASSSIPGGEGAKPAAGAAGGAEWATASVTLADCVLVLPDDEVAYWAAWLWPSALTAPGLRSWLQQLGMGLPRVAGSGEEHANVLVGVSVATVSPVAAMSRLQSGAPYCLLPEA